MNLEKDFQEISAALVAHHEWLLIDETGASFPLKLEEIEIEFTRGKILLGFLDRKGFQLWRVAGYKIENEKIFVQLTRNFDREKSRIKFVPRVAADELTQSIELARLEKVNRLAQILTDGSPRSKIVRAALNDDNGRFAEIVFENERKTKIFALADVSETISPEAILVYAVFKLARFESQRRQTINEIWILAEKKSTKNMRRLHTLLAETWKKKISIKEVKFAAAKDAESKIVHHDALSISQLWREKPAKINLPNDAQTSRTATEIIKLAPDAIDSIFTRHGETLRFQGLPFARVRTIGGAEKCWFGINRNRQILNETTREEFFDLLENLKIYRRFDSPNKRHDFFRLAPEAWLEAILRRDINRLDGNLILSPLYNQFRAGNDKIDLLALRRDGRLIVVELKVETDRAMIFQAIDYWRKIELQRRGGNLEKAKIFGAAEIADKPAIVYLVAPTLAFHRDFEFLSKTVAPEIEIYRFDLNENWREDLKIMRVRKSFE